MMSHDHPPSTPPPPPMAPMSDRVSSVRSADAADRVEVNITEQHDWSLHTNAPALEKNGRTTGQCQLCALIICRLYTLQSHARMTVLSHCYDGAALTAQIRCSLCMLTLRKPAEELLRPDSVPCPCAPRSNASIASTISSGSSSGSKEFIEISSGDDEEMGDEEEEEEAPEPHKSDEDVSLITQLHRSVVNNAALLRQKMSGASKDSPIVVDDAASSSSGSPVTVPTMTPNGVQHSSTPFHKPSPLSPSSLPSAAARKRVGPNLKAARMKRHSSEESNETQTEPGENRNDSGSQPPALKKLRTTTGAVPTCDHVHSGSHSATSNPTHSRSQPQRRGRTAFEMTFASGNTFELSDPSNLFSSFVRKDANAAAQKQQALFAQARKRLETRRQLNIEPEVPKQSAGPYLPYHRGAKHVRDESMAAAASGMPPASATFKIPVWFRSEGQKEYTTEERLKACESIISAGTTAVHQVLCLPNMQPSSWPKILLALAGPADAHREYTPSSILSHHYRRLAKLVHPDKCAVELRGQAENAFKILHQAYTQLVNLL